jgi:branched-chain amino acid aminotransferase
MRSEIRAAVPPARRGAGKLGPVRYMLHAVYRGGTPGGAPGGTWSQARIGRLAPWSLSPFTAALHYGQAIFEGVKARRIGDGAVAVFRLDAHAERFARSAARMAMPVLPPELFGRWLLGFVRHQRRQLDAGGSLYLRPILFASEPLLGARPATEFRFAVLASRVRDDVVAGLHLWVERTDVRACAGGIGGAKTAANYAAAMRARGVAAEHGCHDVLWLDAVDHRNIEEMGGANVAFVARDRLLTPPLGDTILDGITRRCVLALAPRVGLRVEERAVSWRELASGVRSGRITEALALGTGIGIAGISVFHDRRTTLQVRGGPVADALRRELAREHDGTGQYPWLSPV